MTYDDPIFSRNLVELKKKNRIDSTNLRAIVIDNLFLLRNFICNLFFH